MTPLDLPDNEAEVDVCESCGGMWVDWFDGEVRKIATETLRISEPNLKAAAEAAPESEEKPPPSQESAIGACPRCSQHLVAERYVMTAPVSRGEGKTSLIPGKETGAELLRCEACMGAYVTHASAQVLAFLDMADEAPPSIGPKSLRPLPWPRFVKLLKGFLGIK